MKKRLVMREWVEYVLGGMLFIIILIAMSECENETLFLITHIGALIGMIVIGIMFMLYGRNRDE